MGWAVYGPAMLEAFTSGRWFEWAAEQPMYGDLAREGVGVVVDAPHCLESVPRPGALCCSSSRASVAAFTHLV